MFLIGMSMSRNDFNDSTISSNYLQTKNIFWNYQGSNVSQNQTNNASSNILSINSEIQSYFLKSLTRRR